MSFTVTENAAKRIKTLLQSEPENSFLRVSIQGGGCSGFQYNFTIDDTMTADDVVFDAHHTHVVLDDISLSMLSGGILDYIENMVASKFVITNPNAASGCGCGNSFSV